MNAIAAVAARLEVLRPRTGRHLVEIDGSGGSGGSRKTYFAAALTKETKSQAVVVLHADDFFNPPEVRHARGRHAPEGVWLDTSDYNSLIGDALEPLTAGHNHYGAAPAALPSVAAEDALVLV